ncbi:MAG: hypothetical protein IKQ54_03200 [Oscillospiraceae bacterium]|nr:hypothetical protein [Oscillospiraceae bacterium]
MVDFFLSCFVCRYGFFIWFSEKLSPADFYYTGNEEICNPYLCGLPVCGTVFSDSHAEIIRRFAGTANTTQKSGGA